MDEKELFGRACRAWSARCHKENRVHEQPSEDDSTVDLEIGVITLRNCNGVLGVYLYDSETDSLRYVTKRIFRITYTNHFIGTAEEADQAVQQVCDFICDNDLAALSTADKIEEVAVDEAHEQDPSIFEALDYYRATEDEEDEQARPPEGEAAAVLPSSRQACGNLRLVDQHDRMSDEEFLAHLKKMAAEDAERQRKYLETQESWRREEEERKNRAKGILFRALNERLDIAWIEVDYDGSGDEGQIEEIRYLDIDRERLRLGERNLDDAVEEYVFSLLPGGWEINEGSYGTVEIDVIEGKAHVTHSERVTQEYTEEFDE